MAAGVLALVLGQASRLIRYIDDHRKEYIATMTLGVVSDTQDAWGQLEETGNSSFTMPELHELAGTFVGITRQTPPMHSAVHHQGRRLYELARQGLTVERPEREVKISAIEIIELDETQELPRVVMRVKCSQGTYIRTLCHDIGERLGTGAVMSQLLRSRSGPFTIEQSTPLDEIRSGERDLQAVLMPIDYPLGNYPSLVLPEGSRGCWQNGRPVEIGWESATGQVRVYDRRGEFMGMALVETSADQKLLKPQRVISLKNGV